MQESRPLSDSDLLILREWIAERAVGYLLFGVHISLSVLAISINRYVFSKER